MTASTLVVSGAGSARFGDDVAFLRKHTDTLVLSDRSGQARVAVAPAWQGRVMTSTLEGDDGLGFGWINRQLIASGKLQPHINVFGGEDRFWIGPEGGQFSIFFTKGVKFELANWFTPPPLDTMAYKLVSRSPNRAEFEAEFNLTNYSGTRFEVKVERVVRVLEPVAAWEDLKMDPIAEVRLVAVESDNTLINAGRNPWKKNTGLLSIWILGQFNSSPGTTIVVPIKPGPESELGVKVTSDYFGQIPSDRLAVKSDAVFLKADAKYRSKIGINPRRSQKVIGSYDADNHILTIMQFSQPAGVTDYVNSLWKLQDNPYNGDVANSYNDGPPSPGAPQLGPFYELESSSPAAALAPGQSLSHIHRTIHIAGPEAALNAIVTKLLGVSLEEIRGAFQ
jgi:Family of unknown function (DUF6786)